MKTIDNLYFVMVWLGFLVLPFSLDIKGSPNSTCSFCHTGFEAAKSRCDTLTGLLCHQTNIHLLERERWGVPNSKTNPRDPVVPSQKALGASTATPNTF